MTHPSHGTQLMLTDDHGLGRLTVDMQAFFEFSFWMAEELEDLVAQHRPHAARGPRLGPSVGSRLET